MLELTVLIISILVILLVLYLKDNIKTDEIKEEFENFYLSACPSGYKSFYNNDGNTVCCDGNMIANKCLSDNQCTLNGKGTSEMPNCTELLQKMYLKKSRELCMESLPDYFEDTAKNMKGCTLGGLNKTMTAPKKFEQPQCFIFPELEKNINFKNSCINQKLLDLAQCFGSNCTKELTQPIPNVAPLVAIGFTDSSGMHRVAYTRESMENFLNKTNPNWKEQGIDLNKNINVANIAKAFYVDKTIDQSLVQF